ncbi:hypothetical protein RCF63_22850, partial [Klebsiella pneumoniae subsp. pneumoniae]
QSGGDVPLRQIKHGLLSLPPCSGKTPFGTGMHMCIGMGIALNFASSFIADICVRGSIRNVNITGLAEGVSALGASSFSMGMNGHELDES